MKKEIAERIRKARLLSDLSQENIAAELGISPGAYSNIETGKTDITVSRLFEIAEALKINVLELLFDKKQASVFAEKQVSYSKETDDISQLKSELGKIRSELDVLKHKAQPVQYKRPKKKK